MKLSGAPLLLACAAFLASLPVDAASAYDEAMAVYAVDFAGASYCAGTLGSGVDKWNCAACKKHPLVTNTTVIEGHSVTKTLNGFIAYDSDVDTIVLSFAGTDPLKLRDWIDDLDFFKTNFDLCEKYGSEKCEVHEGFYDTYKVARDQVVENVAAYQAAFPTASLIVTGHSLGAILAVIASLDLIHQHGVKIDHLYTFGQPRGGDDAFARFVVDTFAGQLEGGEEFRLVHNKDPVPHLPPKDLLGKAFFHHPAREVFYSELDSTGSYSLCNDSGEDPACGDQYSVALDLLMHLHYVGFDFISNYLACEL